MVSIAHIVNPVKVSRNYDLFIAQPITFETMKKARESSASTVRVFLFSAQYPEDRSVVPSYLTMTRDLDRSILDIVRTAGKRKLPLIKDILDRLYETSNANYFIYTNVDIGLKTEFYNSIANYIQKGYMHSQLQEGQFLIDLCLLMIFLRYILRQENLIRALIVSYFIGIYIPGLNWTIFL